MKDIIGNIITYLKETEKHEVVYVNKAKKVFHLF